MWMDSKNICEVVEVGSKTYVDGGLMPLQAKEKGADFLVTEWRMVAVGAARTV